MSIPVTQSATRITCSAVSPRNKLGWPRFIAEITPDAILIWCRHCHCSHSLSRAQCEAAWAKGESAVSACEGGQAQ